jgi:transcriptional regulator with XRE-family HTH domain
MVQMKTVGQVLKDTRESKQITVKQVSNSIKIRESLIEALEQGEYFAFSSDMHLKSFLRSYANYLGLNEEMVMALYRRERRIQSPEETNKTKKAGENKFSLVISKFVTIRGVIASVDLLFFFIIIVFFYIQWKAFNSPPYLEIKTPASNDVIALENIVIEGFTGDPGIKVILDGNEANYVDSLGNFKINAHFTKPGLQRFQLIATNQFNKKTEKTLDLIYKPLVVETKPKVRLKNKSPLPTEVLITKDSQIKANKLTINPDATEEIIFDQKLLINNFEKQSLDLFLNNDANPTSSIDFKDFSIIIENDRPIVKEIKYEPTPTKVPTPVPTVIKQPTNKPLPTPTKKPVR